MHINKQFFFNKYILHTPYLKKIEFIYHLGTKTGVRRRPQIAPFLPIDKCASLLIRRAAPSFQKFPAPLFDMSVAVTILQSLTTWQFESSQGFSLFEVNFVCIQFVYKQV